MVTNSWGKSSQESQLHTDGDRDFTFSDTDDMLQEGNCVNGAFAKDQDLILGQKYHFSLLDLLP